MRALGRTVALALTLAAGGLACGGDEAGLEHPQEVGRQPE